MQQSKSQRDTVPQSQAEPPQPPADFTHALRDALIHLNDPARLLRHPLNAHLAPLLPAEADSPDALRQLLLDAIEALEPPEGEPSEDQNWRPYLALVYRYVDGYSIAEVVKRLHVSPRQLRRELHMGLGALAFRLYARLQHAAPAPAQPGHVQDTVMAEVRSLGVSLERMALGQLLDTLRPAAALLSGDRGSSLEVPAADRDRPLLCDRTLTKQALISCMAALLSHASDSQGGSSVRVGPSVSGRDPAIAFAVRPAVQRSAVAALDADLAESRALLSAQGASLSLSRGADGSCSGLTIRFGSSPPLQVLVVDDNRGMQQLYERYLSGGSFVLRMATSAAEANRLLGEFTPDVIVLDVIMRGVDGWDFLQGLRAEPRLQKTPVVICSVLREPGLARALGAQSYLKKPITAEQLRRALSDVVGYSSQEGR